MKIAPPRLFPIVVLLTAFLVLSGCVQEGIWQIHGMDLGLGAYTGTLEVRKDGDGFRLTRVVELSDTKYRDERVINLVWTGLGNSTGDRSWEFSIALERIGFITGLGDELRTSSDNIPLPVTCRLSVTDGGALRAVYTSPEDPNFRAEETGNLWKLPDNAPLWSSLRQRVKTHSEPNSIVKYGLFELFDSYHDLPEVRPYRGDPEFKKAVHYQIIDMTDADFYQTHPDRLRLVNRAMDSISLAEAEIRANAFATSLSDKASFFQTGLDEGLVSPHGMVLKSLGAAGTAEDDQDSALWTGIYMYTQGLRYTHTGTAAALDNLRHSLAGLFTLMDITGDPRTFARTFRDTGPPINWNWQRGSGEFSDLDWFSGGNNDMSKGLLLGFLTAWTALPADDPLRDDLRAHVLDMLELCVFTGANDAACGTPESGVDLPSTNQGAALLLAGLVGDDPELVSRGLDDLGDRSLLEFADQGGGPFYEYGTSDWSGNHLTLVSTVVLQELLKHTEHVQLQAAWTRAAREAWKTLEKLEPPLHAALALRSASLSTDEDVADATAQALRGLRSFPVPKHPYPVDHSMRDDFVLSPFPALPWKQDWETNSGRQQSLTAYPMYELGLDNYRWNDQHFNFRSSGRERGVESPGVDFLFLYWLARDAGVISDAE